MGAPLGDSATIPPPTTPSAGFGARRSWKPPSTERPHDPGCPPHGAARGRTPTSPHPGACSAGPLRTCPAGCGEEGPLPLPATGNHGNGREAGSGGRLRAPVSHPVSQQARAGVGRAAAAPPPRPPPAGTLLPHPNSQASFPLKRSAAGPPCTPASQPRVGSVCPQGGGPSIL